MKIFLSGPFPRKSSGAARFLEGRLGLSSAGLTNGKKVADKNRKKFSNPCAFGVPLLDKAGASFVFPRDPVFFCVEDALSQARHRRLLTRYATLASAILGWWLTSTIVANLSPSGGISLRSYERQGEKKNKHAKIVVVWWQLTKRSVI